MLQQKIKADLEVALQSRIDIKISTLRMLRASLQNRELEKRAALARQGKKPEPLTEEETVETIHKELKKRNESYEAFEKAGRKDLAEKEKLEAEVLAEYLPPELSVGEIEKAVTEAIIQAGAGSAADLGKVMAILKKSLVGRADFKIVSEMVKSKLT